MSCPILRSVWRDSEGTATVEAAIILPVLFILVFGVFEFSWLIFQQHLISTGIDDAARYIARSATPNDPTIKTGRKISSDHRGNRWQHVPGPWLDGG